MCKGFENYPDVLTAVDISEILRVSKPTVYALMDEGSFPVIKFGRCKRVLKNEFLQWLQEQQTQSL